MMVVTLVFDKQFYDIDLVRFSDIFCSNDTLSNPLGGFHPKRGYVIDNDRCDMVVERNVSGDVLGKSVQIQLNFS